MCILKFLDIMSNIPYTIYMYVHTYMYAYMVNISDCAIGTHEEESGILMRKSYQ